MICQVHSEKSHVALDSDKDFRLRTSPVINLLVTSTTCPLILISENQEQRWLEVIQKLASIHSASRENTIRKFMFRSPSKLLMRIYLVPELMICKTSKEDDNLNNGNSKEDLLTWQNH